MNRAVASQFRRAGIEPVPAKSALVRRWYGRLALCLLSCVLLTASFPFLNQFYLAWVGLVPWLLVLHSCRSQKAAFFWSWTAGLFFFSANLWWLYGVTSIGTPVLMAILGLYWGFTGLLLRGAGIVAVEELPVDPTLPPANWTRRFIDLKSPSMRIAVTAIVFVAVTEWLRGTWPWHGLPWPLLGHSQVGFGWICQIADLVGVGGLSLLMVAVNAWVALWIGHRLSFTGLIRSGIVLTVLFIASVGYGVFRFQTEPASWTDGPRVLAIQPNFHQRNDGAKGTTQEDLVNFHLSRTVKAIAAEKGPVDLVVWSETVMPVMTTPALTVLFERTYLYEFLHSPVAPNPPSSVTWYSNQEARNWMDTRLAVRDLAVDENTAIVTGGMSLKLAWTPDHQLKMSDKGNVAYLFDRHGVLDETQQVKIHLVPFGEYVPFRESFPVLYNLLLKFGPPDLKEYELTPGTEESIHHFAIERPGGKPWTFTTPICFEDVDAKLCAIMVRPLPATPDIKQSDFLVNMTNDGWFAGVQNRQHFSIATFRAIENRVPIARAVNTGISGFIDPLGRGFGELNARTEGTTVGRLPLDSRITLFTRTGPVIAEGSAVITLLIGIGALGMKIVRTAKSRARRVRPQ